MSMRALDFFAGGGLVTLGLAPFFDVVWANDNCPKKALVYIANFGDSHFTGESISDISGATVPPADLAWASFPCQDLSLAGKMTGMSAGTRSSLYYEWLRVLGEMPDAARPKVLCVENVVGFLVSRKGENFAEAYRALRERGYRAGAIVADASRFLPQSRPRCFLIAAREDIDLAGLTLPGPRSDIHPKSVTRAREATGDGQWVWWAGGSFPERRSDLEEICDFGATADPPEKTEKLLSLARAKDLELIEQARAEGRTLVGAGYRRSRPGPGGKSEQRIELRFDGLAGCLRAPGGGSSRQVLVIVREGVVYSRLLTVRETARLMGAPDSFTIPGSYNGGYHAMGDAVAVPVTAWLAEHILAPLSRRGSGVPPPA